MNGLTKPAIKFNYNYGDLVNTVADSVSVPINVVDFVTATDNFEIKLHLLQSMVKLKFKVLKRLK